MGASSSSYLIQKWKSFHFPILEYIGDKAFNDILNRVIVVKCPLQKVVIQVVTSNNPSAFILCVIHWVIKELH